MSLIGGVGDSLFQISHQKVVKIASAALPLLTALYLVKVGRYLSAEKLRCFIQKVQSPPVQTLRRPGSPRGAEH
ncbi:hypothetical protein P775_04480 [Puniceibacterium antarcticum]|uniref:Uncharacterized protein n=1 Tax=Puniceibacterium antarcticum TaxID=1206336 RepID=A0A2G8RJ40_9RHOB|nr:hypothetical protein P775_04480 [Puniceibacterium antarcticum]